MTAFQPFGESFSAGQTKFPAALARRTSRAPQRSWSAAAIFATSSSYRTSQVKVATSAAPAAAISFDAASSTSARRPQIATRSPSRAKRSAAAFPSPVPPPVTSTVLAISASSRLTVGSRYVNPSTSPGAPSGRTAAASLYSRS